MTTTFTLEQMQEYMKLIQRDLTEYFLLVDYYVNNHKFINLKRLKKQNWKLHFEVLMQIESMEDLTKYHPEYGDT